jgi:hypothetical protein
VHQIINEMTEQARIYQILDDLQAHAEMIGSEWVSERVAMLEALIGAMEVNTNPINK